MGPLTFSPSLSGGPSQASQTTGDLGGAINFNSGGGFNWGRDLILPVIAGLAVLWLARKVL